MSIQLSTKNFWSNSSLQMLLLTLVAIIFHGNTINNDYALDDGLVITDNPYTQQGVEGIGEILSKDAYQWFYEEKGSSGELAGGRYRPMSIITFAIEYELLGEAPGVSHGINVLIYLLTGLVLFILLKKFWTPNRPLLSFLVPLLFLIHPIHTEAVANIKGRDELLAFLLVFASVVLLFRYLKSNKIGSLLGAILVYFLALLSKENTITLLAVFPLSIYFFSKTPIRTNLALATPFVGVALIYLFIRYQVVGFGAGEMNDVMNNPFLYASWEEQKATALLILNKYLALQFWPHPLSFDYGFQQIPYATFSDPKVILSIVVHLGILAAGLAGLKQKRIWAFAALYYLITLSIISNLIVELGGTMGERLIYLSSFGFVLALGWALVKIYGVVPVTARKPLAVGALAVLLVASGYKTITRNQDWKNNTSLFTEDVDKVPNSIKANTAAANSLINQYLQRKDEAYLHQALPYYEKAESLYPIGQDSVERRLYLYDNYINRTYIYFTLDSLEQAEQMLQRAKAIKPYHPKIKEYSRVLGHKYLQRANKVANQDINRAIKLYEKAVHYDPNSADAWYNLGGATYTTGQLERAEIAFQKAVELHPDHEKARQGLQAVRSQLNNQR